jgi:hypothetical protein
MVGDMNQPRRGAPEEQRMDVRTQPGDIACHACGARLPAEAAYCPDCGTPRAVASGGAGAGRGDGRRIIGLMVAGAAALVIGIAAALALSRPEPQGVARPSATPSASAAGVGDASTAPSSAAPSPSASAAAIPSSPPLLANRAIAEVTVDDLNLRMQPGPAAEIRGQLQTGARVFIIGAPQEGDGMRWYRVAVVSGPYPGCADNAFCPDDIGWIAEGGTGADPWLSLADVTCPESPMSADQLAPLHPLERLHCYGGNDLTVTGTVVTPLTGLEGPIRYDPFWLAGPITRFAFRGTQSSLWLRFENAPDNLAAGNIIRATVAMEHELAPKCTTSVIPGYFGPIPSGQSPPPVELPERARVVLECRTQLVVKSFEVVREGLTP